MISLKLFDWVRHLCKYSPKESVHDSFFNLFHVFDRRWIPNKWFIANIDGYSSFVTTFDKKLKSYFSQWFSTNPHSCSIRFVIRFLSVFESSSIGAWLIRPSRVSQRINHQQKFCYSTTNVISVRHSSYWFQNDLKSFWFHGCVRSKRKYPVKSFLFETSLF